ncbi:MAG: hypothetical protein GTO63_06160 [Anaerolineae bacterium]|nr:hypothetical protein [Anaerolineae bacterium]NIN94567.1 hypothetical protein [Anaerolineae bacterium]NIQ77628.1 hypothetical protein [Anaerolineae bacterium]
MPKWMEEMFGDIDPEDMRSWMDAMPSMMEQCCGKMRAKEVGCFMEERMSEMMKCCPCMMHPEQREETTKMCREMLDRFEAKDRAQEA